MSNKKNQHYNCLSDKFNFKEAGHFLIAHKDDAVVTSYIQWYNIRNIVRIAHLLQNHICSSTA